MTTTLLPLAQARRRMWGKCKLALAGKLAEKIAAYNTASGLSGAKALRVPTKTYAGVSVLALYRAKTSPTVGETIVNVFLAGGSTVTDDATTSQGERLRLGVCAILVSDEAGLDDAQRKAEAMSLLAAESLQEGLVDPQGITPTVVWRVDILDTTNQEPMPIAKATMFFVACTTLLEVSTRVTQTISSYRMNQDEIGQPFVQASRNAQPAPRFFAASTSTASRTTLAASLAPGNAYECAAASVPTGGVVGVDGADWLLDGTSTIVATHQTPPDWPTDSADYEEIVGADAAAVIDVDTEIGQPSAGDVWTLTLVDGTFGASQTFRITWV